MPKNVGGSWTIVQSGGQQVDLTLNMDRDQSGNATGKISGFARESDKHATGDGRVSEDEFEFTLRWEHGPIGRYSGHFGYDGGLQGNCVDVTNPTSQATWYAPNRAFVSTW